MPQHLTITQRPIRPEEPTEKTGPSRSTSRATDQQNPPARSTSRYKIINSGAGRRIRAETVLAIKTAMWPPYVTTTPRELEREIGYLTGQLSSSIECSYDPDYDP